MLKTKKHKKIAFWSLLIIGLLTCIAIVVSFGFQRDDRPVTPVAIRGTTFTVWLAHSEPIRTHGLSGTKHLGEHGGMLFVFDHDDTWGIWMKDMYIPIDILWLDKNHRIVHMVKNADPKSFPTVYKPEKQSRYVIELAAGTIEKKGIGVGDMADFTIDKESGR